MAKLKKQIVTKLKRSNCNQTQKLKSCKIKKLNCDNSKTQIVIVIKITKVTEVVMMTSFSKNTLTPWQPTTLRAAFCNSCNVFNRSQPNVSHWLVSLLALVFLFLKWKVKGNVLETEHVSCLMSSAICFLSSVL